MDKNKPTEKELDILEVLWNNGPCSVNEIHEKLNPENEVGYTTTLKIMQIMYEKGLLNRQKEGRKHIYSSAIPQGDIQKSMLKRITEKAFGGNAKNLVLQALGNKKNSKEDLREIKEYIESLEKKLEND